MRLREIFEMLKMLPLLYLVQLIAAIIILWLVFLGLQTVNSIATDIPELSFGGAIKACLSFPIL